MLEKERINKLKEKTVNELLELLILSLEIEKEEKVVIKNERIKAN
ncbi:MAG: hypothetical protein ACRDAQ_03625 [Cetobacterium sp.]